MRKNKLVVIIMFIVLLCSVVYAEAPELRNVMPNSWQKVERVTGEEEQRVIEECNTNIRDVINMTNTRLYWGLIMDITDVNNLYIKVYRQQIREDIFYRFFITDSEVNNYDAWMQQHIQILVWQKEESRVTFGSGIYNCRIPTQYETKIGHTSIDIIESGGHPKAVLISQVIVPVNENTTRYKNSQNGQPAGEVECYYFTLAEYNSTINYDNYFGDGLLVPVNIPYITITGSDCLVDINSPLRYGLQSAFDGNPATSYVENTDDDLMWIEIPYKGSFEQIAIINGYARNENLYNRNNRVRTIGIENLDWNDEHSYLIYKMKQEIPLLDNYLSYQFTNVDSLRKISVLSKYNGSSYNDTCIAEFNVFITGNNWLFGDVSNE